MVCRLAITGFLVSISNSMSHIRFKPCVSVVAWFTGILLHLPPALCLGADASPLLVPPKADDIASFGSFAMTPTNKETIYLTVDKEKVMEFLAKGTVHVVDGDGDAQKQRGSMFLSLPENDVIKAQITGLLVEALKHPDSTQSATFFNRFMLAEGVMVTKEKKAFFWRLWNDRLLQLTDEASNACFLVLGPDASPAAQHLRPYWYSANGNVPDPSRAGKLPVPKSEDITAFFNTPQRSYNGLFDLCSIFSEDRILKFIKEGAPDADLAAHKPDQVKPLMVQPVSMSESTKSMIAAWSHGGMDVKQAFSASGVMTTRDGGMIYWKLLSDVVLYLEDAEHRTCVLKLGASDDSVAQYTVNGNVYQSSVPVAATLSGPKWTPGETPPVDEEKAVEIALGELAKIAGEKDLQAWRVSEIQAVPANGTGYYKITLTEPVDPEELSLLQGVPSAGSRGDAVIFVTMDGKPTKIEKLVDRKEAQ